MASSVVAVDVGSGYVKAASHLSDVKKRLAFSSVVGEMPEGFRGSFGTDDVPYIEYLGKTWITGHWAAENIHQHKVEDTLKVSWAGSTGWMVLLIRALADLGIRSGSVSLVTGIPQAAYRTRSGEIIDDLVGEHRAIVDGRPFRVEIERMPAMVLPQAAAGIYYWMRMDPNVRQAMENGVLLGGIDFGTYTTGCAVLENGRPVVDLSFGMDIGMANVADALVLVLHNQYGLGIDQKTAMDFIARRTKVFLDGDMRDISPMIRAIVAEISAPLVAMLRSQWGNHSARMMIGVYGGGGADFVSDVHRIFPNSRLVGHEEGETRFYPVLGMLGYFAARNKVLSDITL